MFTLDEELDVVRSEPAKEVSWWRGNKMPKGGAWILMTQAPSIEMPIMPLSIMFAKPKQPLLRGDYDIYWHGNPDTTKYLLAHVLQDQELDVKRDAARVVEVVAIGGKLNEDDALNDDLRERVLQSVSAGDGALDIGYQVEVRNEYGVALVQPWEYRVVSAEDMDMYIESLKDNTYFMYRFDQEVRKSAGNTMFATRLHYLRSRGIPHNKALSMLFGQITHHNVFYLRPHDELIRMMLPSDAKRHFDHRSRFTNQQAHK